MFLVVCLLACNKEENTPPSTAPADPYIQAVDISDYPRISEHSTAYYTADGQEKNLLEILQNNGINTVRLRLWLDPADGFSGLEEVRTFSEELKAMGFHIWLTLHYSDTWADPSQQIMPQRWNQVPIEALSDSVYAYTAQVVQEIHPQYIQIGNEINNGLLHPVGDIHTHPAQCIELLQSAAQAVRDTDSDCQIMIHFAGIDDASWFFEQMQWVDYDIIGLSYYPIWHGKSLEALKHTMEELSTTYDKEIVLAETAYPFTLDYHDYTHNVVGLPEHLILPDYPATPTGQSQYLEAIQTVCKGVSNGIGFCYWGADLVAFDGTTSTEGSSWENQALFDFDHKALPALSQFEE